MRRKKARLLYLKGYVQAQGEADALYEFVEDEDGAGGPHEDL